MKHTIADNLIKGRRSMPIGTIKNGQIKVAEGQWRPVSKKTKKRRPGGDGAVKKPTKKTKEDNPFVGLSKMALKKRLEKIKEKSRSVDDPIALAKLKKISSLLSQAIKQKTSDGSDKNRSK